MSDLESAIQIRIRLALGRVPGLVMWRNNVGVARHYDGKKVHTVRYGLAGGSSDLIGILNGRFIALEIKRPGEKPTVEQARFLECVRINGGFASVVTSEAEALSAIDRAAGGDSQ